MCYSLWSAALLVGAGCELYYGAARKEHSCWGALAQACSQARSLTWRSGYPTGAAAVQQVAGARAAQGQHNRRRATEWASVCQGRSASQMLQSRLRECALTASPHPLPLCPLQHSGADPQCGGGGAPAPRQDPGALAGRASFSVSRLLGPHSHMHTTAVDTCWRTAVSWTRVDSAAQSARSEQRGPKLSAPPRSPSSLSTLNPPPPGSSRPQLMDMFVEQTHEVPDSWRNNERPVR